MLTGVSVPQSAPKGTLVGVLHWYGSGHETISRTHAAAAFPSVRDCPMKAVSTGSARRSDDRVIGGAHVLVVADDPDVRSSVTSHVLHQFPEAG